MTQKKLDYTLYLNARRWLDIHGIIVDDEHKSMLSKEAVIDTTGRDIPVIIRGFRPGPLAKTQLIPKEIPKGKPLVKAGAKKKVATTSSAAAEDAKEPARDGQPIVFAISPEANPFSKQEDIAKVTWYVPMDGSAEVIIASAIVAPQLAGMPFIRNIKHDMLSYNPLDHSSAGPKIEVIRDPEVIKSEVLYDTLMSDLSAMAKMKTSVDPYTFWLDAHPGDVVRYTMNAEDTCANSEYRHVVK
jgi:hypothetical protein